MKLNEQLKELYASRWGRIGDSLQAVVCGEHVDVKPAYPFLLSLARWEGDQPTEDWYTGADLKVMVFGQETNSWKGDCDDFGTPPSPVFSSDVSMEAVMGIYEEFYATYYHDGTFNFRGPRYGTFHYGFNRFALLLNAAFPNKRIAYVWNNLVKIGKADGKGFCGAEIYALEREHFSVIQEEINILKPDLLLFLTGTYDECVRDNWPDAHFSALFPYAVNEAAQVTSSELSMPAYRTSHPSAHLPKGTMEARLEAIVKDFMEKII